MKRNENNNAVLSLQDLQAKWPEVLKRAQEENHSLPFLLSTSEPMRMEGDTIHVGVQYPFHCDKLNEPKSRAVLEKIVSDVYAMPLRIQGVISARPSEKDNSVEDVLKTLGGRLVG
ncbi:hypothetical protein A2753_03695 [Candidatus Uhrbacteria bacterium RIFCSPHIGHO2_01_FULL_47_11]|nr:MAG: hypothetical protein A2753_03695 [Candidatus Uhrbacteria bacterium RIFCSPHIGHO2_01_FULL_47_11]